ncbi:Do family serine endopeptidase [Marinicauda algicola]|uniref:Do family serine endopeptidase n=1 Tax=Marinicauda algicola TaxID=2029849 RepID=A0A4S2H3L8_9PROT|nr:Do family serine endopeptidase [Marinicauda algicola]TGY89968.1 Do family serine endopeptidase [Marinicauda algicola]
MTLKTPIRTLSAGLAAALLAGSALPALATAQDARPLSAAVPEGAPMSFADLIEQVSPAVVSIETRGTIEPSEMPDMAQLPPQFREFFERFGGVPMPEEPQERRAQGSGFFISADGLVVTNYHVIREADEITVVTKDGDRLPAEIIGTDEPTDLALLRVEAGDEGYPFVTLDEDPEIRVGDWVVAVGNPFGLGGTATAGIVSAIGRPIGAVYTDFIQLDAPINRGNSGGPAFDLEGNVIGVNSAIFSPTGGNVGIGFAIPSDLAANVISQLMETGAVSRGYLGVRPQTLTDDLKDALGLDPDLEGVLVPEVIAGTPAAEGGLENGDVILAVNGEPVANAIELTRRIGAFPPGERVRLSILRDGEERTVRVRLAERPDEETLANGGAEPDQADRFFGMSLEQADAETREQLEIEGERGLLVAGVARGSQAAEKGIRPGDVIVEAGGEDMRTVADFDRAANQARERGRNALLVLVTSQAGTRYVALQFGEE